MTTTQHTPLPGQDILALLDTAGIPEENWTHWDDLCDCTFQRIGMWTNPYVGRTLKVRLCCIWAKLYAMFPEYVQEVPAFMDYNKGDAYSAAPVAWDGDTDMPVYLWHRQLAVQMRLPLETVRKLFAGRSPPKAVLGGKKVGHNGNAPYQVLPTLRAGGDQSAASRRGERPPEGGASQGARRTA